MASEDVEIPMMVGANYKRKANQPRKYNMNWVNGLPIVADTTATEAPVPARHDPDRFNTSNITYGSAVRGPAIIKDPNVASPFYVSLDRKVLRVYAYFKEAVLESASEEFRVRKCTILLYLVDGTMQVCAISAVKCPATVVNLSL